MGTVFSDKGISGVFRHWNKKIGLVIPYVCGMKIARIHMKQKGWRLANLYRKTLQNM